MIGVVLWSDPEERKAVFWCEDHGDLAYYCATFDQTAGDAPFGAGDMVQFETYVDDDQRRAVNPSLIKQNAFCGLNQQLHTSAKQRGGRIAANHDAVVLPFERSAIGTSR